MSFLSPQCEVHDRNATYPRPERGVFVLRTLNCPFAEDNPAHGPGCEYDAFRVKHGCAANDCRQDVSRSGMGHVAAWQKRVGDASGTRCEHPGNYVPVLWTAL